jgi:hypothetical protein
LFKHVGLITIAVATSSVLMSRVKGGWSLEPLIWLALAWYLGLLFVVDFLLFRGRGRIKTLLVILTGVAVLIMFPFSAIRKADYRARIRLDSDKQGPVKKVELLRQWNWWELPTGECIPRCLAWRVPVEGIDPYWVLAVKPNEIIKYPKWIADEVVDLTIFMNSSAPPLSLPHPLAPSRLTIYPFDRYWQNEKQDLLYNIEWVDKIVNLNRCRKMTLDRLNASKETWSKLLSCNELLFLDIYLSQIPNDDWRASLPKLEQLCLIDTDVGREGLRKLLAGSPNLKRIVISSSLLSSEFAEEISRFNELTVTITPAHSARILTQHEQFKIGSSIQFNGNVILELIEFKGLNLSDPNVQTFIRSTKFTDIGGSYITCRDVKDAIELDIIDKLKGIGFRMDQREVELLINWIAEQSGDTKILAINSSHLGAVQDYLVDRHSTEFVGLFELIRRKVKK